MKSFAKLEQREREDLEMQQEPGSQIRKQYTNKEIQIQIQIQIRIQIHKYTTLMWRVVPSQIRERVREDLEM